MKKIKHIVLGAWLFVLLCACSSTTITETTYAEDGKTPVSQKITESSESPLVIGIANTRDKHVVAHIGGWFANIGVQPSSNSYGIGVGTLDNTYASVVAGTDKGGAEIVQYFPAIVDASKYSLSVSKDGMASGGGIKTEARDEAGAAAPVPEKTEGK